jgi:DNA mismatch repair protein MutL
MSDIIKLLPDSLANQIAAGEVVQRPASAVKELLENSVDSGATSIVLEIRDGGKTLIRVTDNGSGMSFQDARMCFERHATSKISHVEDLFRIRTKGFRGEAMASIAAIAQVQLRTKRKSDDLGTEIEISGSEVKVHRPDACPEGTSVAIRNLFYNVPARRNFLKSNSTEARQVIQEFLRVVLAHPEIQFRMEHQEALIYDMPSTDLLGRCLQVFGNEAEDECLKVEEHSAYLTITGFISKPESARKVRGDQFLFVNDRFVKDGYLHHAIMDAYSGALGKDDFPLYALYLKIDPKHIDINIHPTKTEIKFDDQNAVYQILRSGVRKALGMYHLNPGQSSLMFSGPGPEDGNQTKETTIADFTRHQGSKLKAGDWQALFGEQVIGRGSGTNIPVSPDRNLFAGQETGESKSIEQSIDSSFVSSQEIWIWRPDYIGIPEIDRVLWIEVHAARQRILYEQFLKRSAGLSGTSQQLLYPQTLVFQPGETEILREREGMLRNAGFDLQEFGRNTFLLSGMPPELRGQDAREIIDTFLNASGDRGEAEQAVQEKLARSIALQSRLPKDFVLNETSGRALYQSWKLCENPNFTPDGKPICWILSREEMEKRFLGRK